MTADLTQLLTAASAFLFAAMFLFGTHIHPLQSVLHDRRTIISFGAGISTAYLFVRMMPELDEARDTLGEEGGIGNGMVAYLFAIVGFLLVYGLDHVRRRQAAPIGSRWTAAMQGMPAVSSCVFGMVFYVLLLTYVLVQGSDSSVSGILQHAIAISFHFLAMYHSSRDEIGDGYERRIRFVFSIMCLLGWLVAQIINLPSATPALLLAFVSGTMIVNWAFMELPSTPSPITRHARCSAVSVTTPRLSRYPAC